MKKLIYIICFGAVVSGFDDMQAADLMEAAIARTTEQVTQIEQNQRLEKIRLCAFDFNGAIAALEAKKAEMLPINEAVHDAVVGRMTKQQFRDAHPEFSEFEGIHVFHSDRCIGSGVGAIRFALSVVQNAHVQPRDATHPITEDEMDHILSAVEELFRGVIITKSYFSGLPE